MLNSCCVLSLKGGYQEICLCSHNNFKRALWWQILKIPMENVLKTQDHRKVGPWTETAPHIQNMAFTSKVFFFFLIEEFQWKCLPVILFEGFWERDRKERKYVGYLWPHRFVWTNKSWSYSRWQLERNGKCDYIWRLFFCFKLKHQINKALSLLCFASKSPQGGGITKKFRIVFFCFKLESWRSVCLDFQAWVHTMS